MIIECIRFNSFQKGSFLGFADFRKFEVEGAKPEFIPSFKLFSKDGRRWLNFPSQEYTNKDGEKKYQYMYWREEEEDRRDFLDKALDALDSFLREDRQQEPKKKERQDDTQHSFQEDLDLPF